MYDVINNLYHLIVLLQMETGNVPDRSNNISVSTGLQNVLDRYGTDQKAIRYNGNIVSVILRLPKINQENSAHGFGNNCHTNHLVKFLQDMIKP